VVLHHRQDQCIATEEAVLAAQITSEKHILCGDRQDLHSDTDNLVEGFAEAVEPLDIERMTAEVATDARVRPTENLARLQGHQSESHVV
jgi:hypothetical protein